MIYEYTTLTFGGSAFDNLERVGERLQDALVSQDASALIQGGWEPWQATPLNDHQVDPHLSAVEVWRLSEGD